MHGLKPQHRRRLREIWRSAGWPCHDALELELLAAGLLRRHWDAAGRETLHLSDDGLQALAAARRQTQVALSAHETLVGRVAAALAREGRLVWRGPALRAAVPVAPAGAAGPLQAGDLSTLAGTGGAAAPPALWWEDARAENPDAARSPVRRWALVRPDVFSIRHTTQEDRTDPMVHEIKVSRADLLADLRKPDKGAAYRALSGQCWYVLRAGIAEPQEVPAEYGVLIADDRQLTLARPAPQRPLRLPFAAWMALARLGAQREEWPAGPQEAALVPAEDGGLAAGFAGAAGPAPLAPVGAGARATGDGAESAP